jgi:hypothetical protein
MSLVPGGELVIIDFRRVAGFSSPWVMGHVRAGREQVDQRGGGGGLSCYVDEPVSSSGPTTSLRFP